MINDIFVIYLSFWISFKIRFFYEPFVKFFPVLKGLQDWNSYQLALRAAIPLWILVFALWGRLYQRRFLDAADEFMAIVKSVVLSTLLMIAGTFLYRGYEYSRLVMGIGFLVSISLLFVSRECWKILIHSILTRFIPHETVVVFGHGKTIEAVIKLLAKDQHRTYVCYNSQNLEEAKMRIVSDPSVQEILLSSSLLNDQKIDSILDECEDREIEIKVLPDLLELRLGEIMVDDSLGLPILHLKPLSLHGLRFYVKRAFDVALSIIIVSVFFIPFLMIALFIKSDSRGGIFFIQQRIGFKEKPFQCFKFRTMHQNAEALLEKMKLESFRGGPAFKMKSDPRITRVGKWLRKFSMDELPQIWNILKGEMSFIGPRPQVLKEANGNPEWAKKRFRILPGITGLWQVSGRADLTYEDMMRLDIYYLENWSPGLDLKILLKTFPVVLSSRGAY